MKKCYHGQLQFIALLFGVFSSFTSNAQTGWQWGICSTEPDSANYDAVASTADKSGNLFFAGFAWGDSIRFGSFTLYPGTVEMIISKTDTSGHVLWMLASAEIGNVSQMATDDTGNLYVYGSYDTLLTIGTVTLASPASSYFLLKVSPSGAILWAQNISSIIDMWCNLAVDGAGNSYVTGGFYSSLTVGAISLTGGADTIRYNFLEKYSPSGALIWAKSFGGSASAITTQIAVTKSGKCYVYGNYFIFSPDSAFWHITIGSTVLITPIIPAAGSSVGAYLAKFDSSGVALWAENLNYPFTLNAMTTDYADRLYVTGELDSSIVLGVDTLTEEGEGDAFVARYDSSGHPSWANTGGGSTRDYGQSIALDSRGDAWIIGAMGNGSVTPVSYTMSFSGHMLSQPDGYDAAFMARYDSAGHFVSALALKSGGDDYIGIATDNCGNVYAGGDYMITPMIFGPDTLTADTDRDPLPEYFFVAKYRFDTFGCFDGTGDNSYNRIDTVICTPTDTFTYTLTAPAGTGYLWYDGATARAHAENTPGIYWVSLTAGTNFVADTFHVTFAHTLPPCNTAAGINTNPNGSDDIAIYPNPASSTLYITAQSPITQITITNLLGQAIYSCTRNSSQVKIDVSSMSPGLYFIKVNGNEVRKWVKE